MLPVRQVESHILAQLTRGNRLVLSAPTGSGKTTQVPQMLLNCPAIDGQIIVLQPRRLATRMVARRVADELNVSVGDLVGYQTRHDSAISDRTRIRFMTEGLFLRLLQSNSKLRDVGAVVLDEFHERNLDADLSLGLVRRLQESGRPDLRLIVMSATLDIESVSSYLGCDAIEATGRAYPVEITYLPKWSGQPPWDLAAAMLEQVLEHEGDGDVLIFMPGAYEIRRTIEACRRRSSGQQLAFFPLHGSLPPAEQDAAVSPHRLRKVVVSTNVAETSLTIPGIRHVIDSGLARVHRFDAQRGLNVLELTSISQASADQRAGRAGRTAPGTCRRLWTQSEHRNRPSHEVPEVRRLDLTSAMLQMLDMGIADVQAFPWLGAPDEQAVARGMELLHALHAVDEQHRLTSIGQTMARFPAHPRLSRMLIEADRRHCLGRAVKWAALIAERDLFAGQPPARFTHFEPGEPVSDMVVLERGLEAAAAVRFHAASCRELGVNAGAGREVERTCRLLERICRRLDMNVSEAGTTGDLIRSLLVAFPDHVAFRREVGRADCAVPGHKRVVLDAASVVRQPGPLVALEVREIAGRQGASTVLSLASAVAIDWLEDVHPDAMRTVTQTVWNEQTQAAEEREQRCFGELVVTETVRPARPSPATGELIVQKVLAGELAFEHWNEKVQQWIERVRCVAAWFPERSLIRYDDDDLSVIVHEIVGEATRWGEVAKRPLLDAVRNALDWNEQQFVEQNAPESLRLPSGHNMKLSYQKGAPPRGRAKIQQLYSLTETPRVAGGRITVTLEILGPNFRPVQVTDDLASFWANTYPQLKKELKRRYPKHEWR